MGKQSKTYKKLSFLNFFTFGVVVIIPKSLPLVLSQSEIELLNTFLVLKMFTCRTVHFDQTMPLL